MGVVVIIHIWLGISLLFAAVTFCAEGWRATDPRRWKQTDLHEIILIALMVGMMWPALALLSVMRRLRRWRESRMVCFEPPSPSLVGEVTVGDGPYRQVLVCPTCGAKK